LLLKNTNNYSKILVAAFYSNEGRDTTHKTSIEPPYTLFDSEQTQNTMARRATTIPLGAVVGDTKNEGRFVHM
jgi:hypothetical protein